MSVETERVVAQTMIALDRVTAQKHAGALFRLAGIRARLGEHAEAERLYDRAAVAFLKLSSPINTEFAALARISQAGQASAEGRSDEALATMNALVEQHRGFPKFEHIPDLPDALQTGLDVWTLVLEQVSDYERLYVVAGTVPQLLNEAGPPKERLVIARALARRAKAARALGHNGEAVELYEQSIARFKQEDPAMVKGELIETVADLMELQADLGLTKNSIATLGQLVKTTATTMPKLAGSRLFGSRRKPR